MAQTVYAGQLGVGLGLQGASETIADSMAIQNDNDLVKAKLSQMAATEEAIELENQLRKDERERVMHEASVEGLIMRQALEPEKAAARLKQQGPEKFLKPYGDLTAEQSAKLEGIVGLGQQNMAQREAQAQLSKGLKLASMIAMTDAGASPGYAEGLADLSARLEAYNPMDPNAETPQELAAEFRALKEQDFIFRSVRSDRERAGVTFDTTFGTGEEYAALREMYLDHDAREDALNQAYALKFPKAAAKAKADAGEAAIGKFRAEWSQGFLRHAAEQGWDLDSEEWTNGLKAWIATGRELAGEEAFPLTPKEQAEQAQMEQEDAQLKLLQAAGLSLEEGIAAVERGPEAVDAALAKAVQDAAAERARAEAEAKEKARAEEAKDKTDKARSKKNAGAVRRAQQTMGIPPGVFERELMGPPEGAGGDDRRRDGSKKDRGFLGEQALPDGRVATEYSIGVELDGKEVDIPTLVPTLTKAERDMMVKDIIPNGKEVPEAIVKKAVAHARKRMADGKSPFYSSAEGKAP